MASKRLTLFTVTVGSFLATLNLSSVNIALPTAQAEMGGRVLDAQLVLVGYVATVTLLLIPFGRLGDLVGRRRFYAAGFALFAIGSSLCSIAPSMLALAAFRMLQGVGAAMIIAQGSAIIASVFPEGERGAPLAWQVVANSLGSSTGYVLAGLLTDALGWRSVFWTNAPVAAVGAILVLRVIPRGLRSAQPFDFRSAALLAGSLGLLIVAVNASPDASTAAVLALAASISLAASFSLSLRRSPSPLIPLALRRSRVFLGGVFAALFGFMASSSSSFIMTFYLQTARGFAPRLAGLVLLSYSAGVITTSLISGRISDRLGGRPLATLGLLCIAAGLVLLSNLGASASLETVAVSLSVVGAGIGLFASPNNNAVFAAASRQDLGVANGLLGTMRNLGVALGVSVAGLVFAAAAPGHVFPTEAEPFASAMRAPLLLAACLAIFAAALSLLRGRGPTRSPAASLDVAAP